MPHKKTSDLLAQLLSLVTTPPSDTPQHLVVPMILQQSMSFTKLLFKAMDALPKNDTQPVMIILKGLIVDSLRNSMKVNNVDPILIAKEITRVKTLLEAELNNYYEVTVNG